MLGKAEIETGVVAMCDMPPTGYIENALLKLMRMFHVAFREHALQSWAQERGTQVNWETAVEFMALSNESWRNDLKLLAEEKPLRQTEERIWSWVTSHFGATDEELFKLSTLVEQYDDSTRKIVLTHMHSWSSSDDIQTEIMLSMKKAQHTLNVLADKYKLQRSRTAEWSMQLCPQYQASIASYSCNTASASLVSSS